MSLDFTLTGRRALITGASTGIGQAIAVAMAEAGAGIVCADIVASDETVARITASGGAASQVALDLTKRGAIDELMAKAGDIDILVNCAGIIRRADVLEFTEADWDQVMDINLKVVFFLSQAFARALLKRGGPGAIINIASMLSFQGGIRIPSYTASKSGVAGLTKLLCNEWAAKGINVNAIAPGYVATNNTAPLQGRPGALEGDPRAHPGRALGRPGGHCRGRGVPGLARRPLRPRRHLQRRWRLARPLTCRSPIARIVRAATRPAAAAAGPARRQRDSRARSGRPRHSPPARCTGARGNDSRSRTH